MYTMYFTWRTVVRMVRDISKIFFIFTGFIRFVHILIFCWRCSTAGKSRISFLHYSLCQLTRQNVPLTTLLHVLPSSVRQFLSCVNSDTYWSLFSGEGLFQSLYFYQLWPHWWYVTHEALRGSVFPQEAFPVPAHICLGIYSPAHSERGFIQGFPAGLFQFIPVCFLWHKTSCNWSLKVLPHSPHSLGFYSVQTWPADAV